MNWRNTGEQMLKNRLVGVDSVNTRAPGERCCRNDSIAAADVEHVTARASREKHEAHG
jgi:hypothetical protein